MKRIVYYIFAPFRFLYKVYFILVFLILAIPMFPLFYFLLKTDKRIHQAFKLKRIWAKLLLLFTGILVVQKNKELLPKSPFVVCANHASYLDIVLMFIVIPNTFLFLGKAELLKWPIIKIFFRNMDIPVDRSNGMKAKRSIELTKEAVQKGFSIAIFPEGLIPSEGIPKMKPFKRGAFVLAVSQQVDLVPVTFANNWKLFATESDLFGPGSPGIAKVIFHSPISTKGKTEKDIPELVKETFSKIEKGISY
ncbi:MAG: lysophospholipid acyltransferase family protein [Flavobacteriales bacterium]